MTSMDEYNRKLHEQMAQLDETDREIARLLDKRLRQSEEIAKLRISSGNKLFDKTAEAEKLSAIRAMAGGAFEAHAAEELFTHLFAIGRKKQYRLLHEMGAAGRLPFIEVDDLERENVRVVFQGVEGAYSHAAMCSFFGDDVNSFHVRTWREAMEAIADGEADYAVLPIENSSAGIVGDNFDLLVDFENYIVAEQVIRCEHVLMGLPGVSIDEITEVYSHPQALAQCARFLDEHMQWRQVPFDNTALAARKVAEDGIRTRAAIGSRFAAERFGLAVLAEHIYFNEANSTRFIIATNQRIFRKDASRISICFETPHRSGSLYSILSHIIYNDLNMQRIESRPIAGRNWEYRFFVDFDGNLNSSSVKSALRGIRAEAINMKILGNY
jgi:chorismate mutase/prephenate dehydratase